MVRDLYVAKSKIAGSGVFAKNNFKKGDVAFIAKGNLVKLIIHSKKDSLLGPNWISISKNLWLNPFKDNLLTFLNHSCAPNLGVVGSVTFVALKNIRKDEELTVDYSILELDPLWKMKCGCGAKNCRKTIRSINFLSKKRYNLYLPFVPQYLQKMYNKSHS
ncbi:MAG: hypothetical protein COV96_00345 [Candidatus Zambryskibacteria bacterium CG11_big_fil_rev_8_21_14_0_20_42_18]|nr:MAG: hypothetical protein COV96_00345 [Candidatus Zambryskibacteria bacterium CG11_big_fil_rev_8_21_14_0_20_42_18]